MKAVTEKRAASWRSRLERVDRTLNNLVDEMRVSELDNDQHRVLVHTVHASAAVSKAAMAAGHVLSSGDA